MRSAVPSRSSAHEALRSAVTRAALSPSVCNSQPWRFRLTGNCLELRVDWTRQLPTLDPLHRQLLISCGCALFNVRVGLAASGYRAQMECLPRSAESGLLARIYAEPDGDRSPIAALDAVIEQRHTHRGQFGSDLMPAGLADALVAAAEAESTGLFAISTQQHQVATRALIRQASKQNADPCHRAELRAWTTEDSTRLDGVPAPRGSSGPPDNGFDDAHGIGWLPAESGSAVDQCLLLLTTEDDSRLGWLRAGEALERIWLVATQHGYALKLHSQAMELPGIRSRLQADLGLTSHPLVLLRIGRGVRTTPARRRPVAELWDEDSATPNAVGRLVRAW